MARRVEVDDGVLAQRGVAGELGAAPLPRALLAAVLPRRVLHEMHGRCIPASPRGGQREGDVVGQLRGVRDRGRGTARGRVGGLEGRRGGVQLRVEPVDHRLVAVDVLNGVLDLVDGRTGRQAEDGHDQHQAGRAVPERPGPARCVVFPPRLPPVAGIAWATSSSRPYAFRNGSGRTGTAGHGIGRDHAKGGRNDRRRPYTANPVRLAEFRAGTLCSFATSRRSPLPLFPPNLREGAYTTRDRYSGHANLQVVPTSPARSAVAGRNGALSPAAPARLVQDAAPVARHVGPRDGLPRRRFAHASSGSSSTPR